MPKKFSEQEREWVYQKLLSEGRRSFETFGLKKTSVEELTKAAGIAQGSFYKFFGSKEELLFEIIQEDEKKIRDMLMESFHSAEAATKEGIKQFLLQSFQLMEESPLLRKMTLSGEMEQLARKLPKETLEQNYKEDQDALIPLIAIWQARGILPGVEAGLIVSLIRAIVLLTMHKEEIGNERFSGTMELLAEVMASGIVTANIQREGMGEG
ncbi:TetR/AcrR family transcriptional regulator [Paenibacillus sp. DYY-L-2]|uniref:TetR/AcrR family transcriptional regulator n=1 Tax=Paenibacillus sp. DYY-L-2 TaxID=3447013 RepID=UPI003F4FB370